ncbi:MAG: hypothetical protein ACFFCH_11080 [Promethearchaeota archaeon]
MRRTQLLSLFFLTMLCLPLLPINFLSGTSPSASSTPTFQMPADFTAPSTLTTPTSSEASYQLPDMAAPRPELASPDPVLPEIINPQSGTGNQRAAHLYWNISQTFTDCTRDTDYQVAIDKGMLYHDISFFSRLGNMSSWKDFQLVEDWNPLDGWYYYWPMEYASWPGEISFMAFDLTGKMPVIMTEFAIYLASFPGSLSSGLVNYTIFAAEANSTSGLGTRPDLSKQLGPWMQEYVDVPPDSEQWWTLPTLPIPLDPGMTYANTFYFAITMMPGAAINWAVMEDVGSIPEGDGEDEGDAWNSYPYPTLYFISGPSIDFFLICAYERFPYPSEIGLMVNGTPVFDIFPMPGVGYYDGGWHSPAINMTKRVRYYDVEQIISGLTFDVTWLGWFYETLFATTRFQVWSNRTTVDWNITLYADYPVGAIDQSIMVAIEDDWTPTQVLHDGLPHADWFLQFQAGQWWVHINNADDGEWVIQCESPDYVVDVFVRDQYWNIVTEVYSADWVTVFGHIQNSLSQNVSNGQGYLFVYDPFDTLNWTNFNWLTPPPPGLIDFYWNVWQTAFALGDYTLHVIWSNGYEAGMREMTLKVNESPTYLEIHAEEPPKDFDVVRGQKIELIVYYEDYTLYPLYEATVTVENDTSGADWNTYDVYNLASEGYYGYYHIVIFTDNASINVQHNITLHVVQNTYQEQTYSKTFIVKSAASHIIFINGAGLENSTGVWRTSPEPLINSTNHEFTILYTDDTGIPISGAIIFAYLLKGPTEYDYRRLDWEELAEGQVTTGLRGQYNITVDLNPIRGVSFHEGEEAVLIVSAYHPALEAPEEGIAFVRPQPRPTVINVPTEFQNIVLYEDWQYPTIEHPTILRVVLRDALNGEDLSHGTVKAGVNGGENTTLTLATPGIGLYEIPSLNTDPLEPGTYNVTIYAEARDFTDSIAVITLTVLPKQTFGYDVQSNFDDLQIPNHGQPWWISLQLFLENVSNPVVSLASGGLSRQPTMVFLPPGTEVILTITASGGNYEPIIGYVGDDGWVHFEGTLAHEGEHQFYVSLEGAENYAALTNMQISPSSQPVNVMSMASLITQNLPLILVVAAVAIIVPLGSGLAYRRYVSLPKRQKKLAKYQSIADTFSDVANLNRLLVLHKESGICVFDPFAEESQDATLVAGFLQAISTFGHDLGDSPGLAENSEDARTLRELQYEGFRILINDGKHVRVALVLNGVPSDQLRNRLETFTDVFETRYHADFEHWEGRVDQFNSASDLVEEVFLISLRHPHTVEAEKPRGTSLTSVESDIYKLSKELTIDRQYIFLGQVLSTYLAAAKTDKHEALMGIYQLRMKGLFVPISVGPISPPDTSAG